MTITVTPLPPVIKQDKGIDFSTISKTQIEQLIQPEDIYSKHIDGYDSSSNRNYLSPFKKEKNPSFHIYGEGNKWQDLKYKCHTSQNQGDVYSICC